MEQNELTQEILEGERLFQEGNIEEAFSVFDSITKKQPDNLFAMNDKGVALNGLGRYPEAVEVFIDVLEKDNTNSNAAFNLISNHLLMRNLSGAEDVLLRYGPCLHPKDIEIITKDLENMQKEMSVLSNREGNASGTFNYELIHRDISKTLQKNLFFIMGVPKSGTTWMQHLLDGHPEVICSGEGNFNHIIKELRDLVNKYNLDITGSNNAIGTSNHILFSQQNLHYLFVTTVGLLFSNLRVGPEIKCIGSKNPILIKEMDIHATLLPSSKYIHMIRDGRDVMVSAWFNNLRGNEEDTRRKWPDFTSFVQFGIQQWVSDILKARRFGQAYPERYFELRYEDLHRDPDPNIGEILRFIGVDSSISMIDRCREAGSFEKLARGRMRGQEDRREFFRKGVIGDWKNHFDKDSLKIFMDQGGDLLRQLGYDV